MVKKNEMLRWLYQELPGLVRQGILDSEAAERLKKHYGPAAEFDRKNLAVSIVSIVGALCIGLGIILLFAYNWDLFSRLQKVGISSIPLFVSFIFAAKVGLKPNVSSSSKEATAVFNMMSLGAAIALISQAYHLPADLEKFLLCWMILSVPTVYFLQSSAACLLYLMGITAWAGDAQNGGGHALLFWPLVAIVMPFLYAKYLKAKEAFSIGTFWLMLAVCVCFTVSLGVSLEKTTPGLWIMIYSSFFSLLFVSGSYLMGDEGRTQYPFRRYGLVALVVLSYMLTFTGWWKSVGWNHYRVGGRYHEWAGIFDYVILACLLTSSLILLLRLTKRKGIAETIYGYLPLLATIFFLLNQLGLPDLYAGIFFNGYLLFIGYVATRKGIKEMRLIWLNAGLIIIGGLISTRFFDQALGILGRAVVFIFFGVCLLVANRVMQKKIEHVSHE